MPPTVTRNLQVVYTPPSAATTSAITVGGTSDYELDGQITLHHSWTSASVQFATIFNGTSASDLATKVEALEETFRTPWGDTVVTSNGVVIAEYKHTDSSGFRAMPRIIKRSDVGNTGYSRRYDISIDVEMPADVSNTAGRRDAQIAVATDPSGRRKTTISGTYTSIPPTGSAARSQFEASIVAYASAVLGVLGGTWELGEEPTASEDHQDKLLTFTRVYDEVIDTQAGGSPDSSVIVRQEVTVTRVRIAPGDATFGNPDTGFTAGSQGGSNDTKGGDSEGGQSFGGIGGGGFANPGNQRAAGGGFGGIGGGGFNWGSVGGGAGGGGGSTQRSVRLVELDVHYAAWVRFSQTTDLPDLWNTVIKPFVAQRVKTVFGFASMALVRESPTFDQTNNRITATQRYQGSTGGGVISYACTIDDDHDTGVVLVPAWQGAFAKYKYQGPAILIQTVNETAEFIGGSEFAPMSFQGEPFGNGSGLDYVAKRSRTSRRPKVRGLDGYQITVTEASRTTVYEFYQPIGGGQPITGDADGGGGEPAGPAATVAQHIQQD